MRHEGAVLPVGVHMGSLALLPDAGHGPGTSTVAPACRRTDSADLVTFAGICLEADGLEFSVALLSL